MHVHFTQIKKRVAAAPGDLLLAKAVSSGISVVKADLVQQCVPGLLGGEGPGDEASSTSAKKLDEALRATLC